MARHVRKGDTVVVLKGADKGRTGEVLRVLPEAQRVVVHGVNLRTKHVRPTPTAPQGGVVQREEPIHMSNVAPMADGKATRVRFQTKADGSKVRIAARNGAELGVVHGARDRSVEPGVKAGPAPAPKAAPRKKTAKKGATKKAPAKKAPAKAASSKGSAKKAPAQSGKKASGRRTSGGGS